ncbi:type II toxin-antitoxin system PrlF family antitoxin [Nodularia spumigena]|uniref:type II toxin-antitoxin system PrlF family antitoxin n=1 Tax=Nodularia spumigena TaxID=70799 RepID=UPI0030DD1F80
MCSSELYSPKTFKTSSEAQVVISRADNIESDPVLRKFLYFLGQSMENNPQHLKAISSDLVSRVQSLVSEVDLDLDAPLSDEDE